MPVNAMTMPYLSQHSITRSSRIEPPGSAIYFTPLRFALSMLSLNGKNASEPSDTPSIEARYALISSSVSGSGREVNFLCQVSSAQTCYSFLLM